MRKRRKRKRTMRTKVRLYLPRVCTQNKPRRTILDFGSNMRPSLAFLGLSTQLPLQSHLGHRGDIMAYSDIDFTFKQGPDIFSPTNLV